MAETVMSYAQSMDSLAAKCNQAQAGSVPPSQLVIRFADGLHTPRASPGHQTVPAGKKPEGSFDVVRHAAIRWTREEGPIYTESLQSQPSAMALEVEQLHLTGAALTAKLWRFQSVVVLMRLQ
ncbi:hypothetical protein BaRGS_00026614 [Batillaria attramentaria]|uniref:Uncharacterized protein n=1 Tax=Batillaria attramentaria TaxID=370345 RepID=A0ABD0K4G0_9CAEN